MLYFWAISRHLTVFISSASAFSTLSCQHVVCSYLQALEMERRASVLALGTIYKGTGSTLTFVFFLATTPGKALDHHTAAFFITL